VVHATAPFYSVLVRVNPSNPASTTDFTCDLCTDLSMPSCVYACPHDAAHRVDPNEFFRSVISLKHDAH